MKRTRVNKIHAKLDNTEIDEFISKNFHRRDCTRYVEAARVIRTKDDDGPAIRSVLGSPDESATNFPIVEYICQCGYSKAMHSNEVVGPAAIGNTSMPWSVEEDTEAFPTNAHGIIEFDETDAEYNPFNNPTVKRFIRLDHTADVDKVIELFREKWIMDRPQLFLSIISSDKDPPNNTETHKNQENQKIKDLCKKLVEAATQTNAWVITEGATDGIGEIVGDELVKILDEKGKRPKAVLSICNWGCIRDKYPLINENKRKNYRLTTAPTNSICHHCDKTKKFSLDRNHTNFVFVDDGRQFHPGCEKSIRHKIELKLRKYVTRGNDEDSSTDDFIPFVYFLIGGNADDVHTVESALANEMPVVIAKGTGGAADLIAENMTTEKVDDKKIKKLLILEDIHDDNNELVNIRYKLQQIKNSKGKLLVLFDTSQISMKDGNQDVSGSILTALKATKNSATNIFVLAADWDNKVFFKDLLREKPEGSDLDDVMWKLLQKDSHVYVEVLLGYGVNLIEAVKHIEDDLENPFTQVSNVAPVCSFFQDAVMSDSSHSSQFKSMVGKDIVAHLTHPLISGKEKHPNEVKCKLAKLLCLWSTYNGKTNMAKVFWREGKDYLALALMAYKISKEQRRELKGKEGYSEKEEQMKAFHVLAVEFLTTCDKDNRSKTIALLRGRVPDLEDLTPMQIAFDGDFKEFVAEPSFRELLDKIWTKRIIDYGKIMYIPLMIAVFCPFAAPLLFEYHDYEQYRENLDEHNPTMRSFLFFSWKVRSFLDAPVIKFIYHTLSYLAYLVLFSIVMLTDFRTTISPAEIILTIWTFILIIEEGRQVTIFGREYLNKWNMFDAMALILYVIGFVLRMIYQSLRSSCSSCLYVARNVLAISLMIAMIRVLQILSINLNLGPKIYMISRLLRDLISFMLILAVFISAYGVVSNVILYPNQPLNAQLLHDVFYDAWWSVIGQFNREEASGSECNETIADNYCSSTTRDDIDYVWCKQNQCPANTWLVSVLVAFYALLTVIMLLNVLIAMFGVSFEKIIAKQQRVSIMQFFRIIREYNFRPMIPAPLCIFDYLKYVPCLCILCKYCCCCMEDDHDGEMNLPSMESSSKNIFSMPLDPEIAIWERRMREKYEEEIKIKQLSEPAIVVLNGGEFKLVFRNPHYVERLMQYSLAQIEKCMDLRIENFFRSVEFNWLLQQIPGGRESLERKQTGLTNGQDKVELHIHVGRCTCPDNRRYKGGSTIIQLTPPDPVPANDKATQTDPSPSELDLTSSGGTRSGTSSLPTPPITPVNGKTIIIWPPIPGKKKSCIHRSGIYGKIILQGQGRRMKKQSKSVKAYPGRSHLRKIAHPSADCKITQRINGKDFEFQSPYRTYGVSPKQYGVPLKTSQFPAYRLPFYKPKKQSKKFAKGSMGSDNSTSDKKEIKTVRMPYGGVFTLNKKDDSVYVLFDHKYHRGKSAPVLLSRAPPIAETVRQEDINESMPLIGRRVTILPSTTSNPEVSHGASVGQRPLEKDKQ